MKRERLPTVPGRAVQKPHQFCAFNTRYNFTAEEFCDFAVESQEHLVLSECADFTVYEGTNRDGVPYFAIQGSITGEVFLVPQTSADERETYVIRRPKVVALSSAPVTSDSSVEPSVASSELPSADA